MPKKLPSSSEAPWITLLAYHQRNLDLATICWKYWGVTEALASLRQHSLHIWPAGQPARILSPGYCPAGPGTGSSTSADRNECTAFHSTAHPDNSMRAEVFQLVHRVEHLRAKKSSQGSFSSSKGSFVSKMTRCGDHREGRSVSWDTPASDVQCVLRDVWKRVKDSGIFPRSYKSLVVNDNTCHE